VLLARVSDQLVIQAPAYLEVPEGVFMGLKLTGVYASLDWAYWGDYTPLSPASREGLHLFHKSNGQTAGILKHRWSITQIKPIQHLRPGTAWEISLVWPRRGRQDWG